jgi:putative hemin transport protein
MSSLAVTPVQDLSALAEKLKALRAKNPHAYPRDYAAELGVSEAMLTPLFYGDRVQALNDLGAVLASLSRLPQIKLMARVSYAVLEIFSKVEFVRENGLYVSRSASCFVALDPAEVGNVFFLAPDKPEEKAAILIFEKSGAAALKLYLRREDFDASLLTSTSSPTAASGRSAGVSAALQSARAEWLGNFSPPVATEPQSARQMIAEAAEQGTALAFELESSAVAVLLRHIPQKLIDARGWFNILDAQFNLHLKEDSITRVAAAANAHRKMLRLENAAGEKITIVSLGEK